MYPIETSIYTAVLITGVVLGALLIYFGITIFRNQRKHFKLLSEHFLEEMERLEKERIRIATDLHDELGPILSVTQIHIDKITPSNDKDATHLKRASENILVLTKRFGGIARNLTPRVLLRKGLNTALHDFFEQYQDITSIKLEYRYNVKTDIATAIGLHIYRMIQEMVHNAVKHSQASRIEVLLHEKGKKIYIQCKDDGIGMNSELIDNKKEGLGLNSLKSRAEMLGGKMIFNTSLKKGTEYFFEIPITWKNENTY